jgi:hypothetical protein
MAKYGAIEVVGTDDEGDIRPSVDDDDAAHPPNGRRGWTLRIVGAAAASLAFLATYTTPNHHYLPTPGGGPIASLRCRLSLSSSSSSSSSCDRHDENEELFYVDQLVNHFDDGDTSTWKHRYYKSVEHFGGPGRPIFHVVGGEGALDFGMLYPFVTRRLAPHFRAAVIQVEHRFYGPYRPITGRDATVSELLELLTPQQAMADNVRLGRAFGKELGCSDDRDSSDYCPVITVGGSYPGFLSAMLRVAYPDYADMSYASSAPLKLYDQSTDQNVYYDIVSTLGRKGGGGGGGV